METCHDCDKVFERKDEMTFCPYCGAKLKVPFDNYKVPYIEEYTQGEVNEHFKRLYKLAVEMFKYKYDNGYEMKDQDNWCFESVMRILGKDIWTKYNRLS